MTLHSIFRKVKASQSASRRSQSDESCCCYRLQVGHAHPSPPIPHLSAPTKRIKSGATCTFSKPRQPGTNAQSRAQTRSVPSRPGRCRALKLFICQSVRVCAPPPEPQHPPNARAFLRSKVGGSAMFPTTHAGRDIRFLRIFGETAAARVCVGATKHKLFPREPVKTRCAAS